MTNLFGVVRVGKRRLFRLQAQGLPEAKAFRAVLANRGATRNATKSIPKETVDASFGASEGLAVRDRAQE